MKILKLALLALGALAATPSVFALDFVTDSPPNNSTTTNDGPKPNILWSVDLRDVGMDSANSYGTGIAVTFSKIFITVEDCSLVIMDRSDTDPTNSTVSYRYESTSAVGNSTLCATTLSGANTRPVALERGDGSLAVYPTGDGHVVAVNDDGTEAWKTFIGVRVGIRVGPLGNVRLSWQNTYVIVTYNTDAGGQIVWLSLEDGSINESLGLTVPNDLITSLSNFGVFSEQQFLFLGKTTGNLYRLNTISDSNKVEQNTSFEVLAILGVPNENMTLPAFPPLLEYPENDPIVKNWAHAVNSQVYGFVTDYNAYDWRKAAPEQGGVGNGLLSAGSMVCYGWFSINCYDKDSGKLMWGRPSIKRGVYGDPDLWARSQVSDSARTVLITNLVYGELYSLDPVTGENMWLLDCRDFREWGIEQCSSGVATDGYGAMALSPDSRVVYFHPGKFHIMAAEVFIEPTPSPTMKPSASPTPAPTMKPTASPTSPGATPEPTQAPSGSPRVGLCWLVIASMTAVVLAHFAAI
jgi:hypothetical protein